MTITTWARKHQVRLIAVVSVVVVIAAAIVYVMVRMPEYRIAFVVDTSVSTPADAGDDFNAIVDAVGSAAQNVGDGDALSLRRFGGACGDSGNTAQIVGSGTHNGQQVSDAVHTLTPGGDTTLQSGILAAIDDFSGFYPFRGKQSNRIIVVTSHGTDACASDQATFTKMIQDRVSAAGLQLDFRFVGYKVPIEQRDALIQAAAATGAPEPKFAQTAADLATILKQLTVPESLDAAPVEIPGLNTDTQVRRPSNLPISPPGRSTLNPPGQGPDRNQFNQGPILDPSHQEPGRGQPDQEPNRNRPDLLPTGPVRVNETVWSNGLRFNVVSATARRTSGGLPEVVVETRVYNEIWDSATTTLQEYPPVLKVGGRGIDTVEGYKMPVIPPRQEISLPLVFPVTDEFRWELATLTFPIRGGAKAACVPLAGNGTVVALKPGSLNIAGSGLIKSERVILNFHYGGTYRTDIGFYDRGQPIGFTKANKGSLRIYFDISAFGDPGAGGINVLRDNFRLTLPNGRGVVQPDWNPNVLLDREHREFLKEAISTEVDTPAAGTYTLTYTERPYEENPQRVKITFTITE
ncbi:MAG: VWA domain-containing protein [Actinomycetota bacterium]|nr:VWA domain-containing protein [Actinomycetota bacterium]